MVMNLELSHIQKLNITENLINAIQLLELNSIELEDYIKDKCTENVMLEYEEKKDKKVKVYISDSNNDFIENLSTEKTYTDFLKEQLIYINEEKYYIKMAEYIIDNLDDRGFFTRDINEFSKDINKDINEIKRALEIVKSLEPRGTGSFNIQECLEAQVENDSILRIIIKNYLEDIAYDNLNRIKNELNLKDSVLKKKIERLRQLNPIPSAGFRIRNDNNRYIIPDVEVCTDNNDIKLYFREDDFENIHLNDYYINLLNNGDIDEDTRKYLEDKRSEAQSIINSIKRRKDTFSNVTGEIVLQQKGFFVKNMYLEKLTYRQIAENLDISISTVSRCVKNKYILCQRGLYPLNYFFPSGIESNGIILSSDYILNHIKKLIEKEDLKQPFSDEKIKNILQSKGINISRRTVNKYRKILNIPSSEKRKRGNYEQQKKKE